jgi:hypothetical protein
MEEAFIWLMRLLALKEMLQSGQGPTVMDPHGGSCNCGEYDIDDMNDLDAGRPYIWNRHADHSC